MHAGKIKMPITLTKFAFPTMVIFIKVKDNVKNKLNNQLAAIFFSIQNVWRKNYVPSRTGGGGSSWTPVLNFSNFALGAKYFFRHPMYR